MSTEDPTLVHIGIDFGTSNSVAYVCKKNQYEYVPFQQGAQMPSLVILDNTKFVVGVPPPKFDSVVFKSVKKLLGQSYYDVDLNDDMSTYGCKIVEGPDHMCWYKTEERLYSCDEIAVAIFKKIKEEVDKFTDGKVGRTVVSVPARYSAKQRYHIQKAAEAAGFDVTNLINEPTAASVCVSIERGINGNILVFDLGAGTTDVTILNLQDTIYKVESSCGDDHLGGDDFDNLLLHHIEDRYKEKYNREIWDGMKEVKKNRTMNRLMKMIIHLKHQLSSHSSEDIDMYDIVGGDDEDEDYRINVSRATFERLIRPLTERFSTLIQTALKNSESQLEKADINYVILVGGGCFMPCVARQIRDEFPRAEIIDMGKKMELVAEGCCTCAKKKSKPDFNVIDILSHTIGLLMGDGSVFPLFKMGTRLPTDTLEVILYADRPGIRFFQTEIVELLDEKQDNEAPVYNVLANVTSSEFIPDQLKLKEFSMRFRLDISGIFYMEAYALPENKKCVTKSVEGIPV